MKNRIYESITNEKNITKKKEIKRTPTKSILIFLPLLTTFFKSTTVLNNYVLAHDIELNFVKEGGMGIRAYYSDGTPLSSANVKIFSPSDDKKEFQICSTDKNGYFFFLPDEKGKWRIEISDSTGHGLVKHIEITEEIRVLGANYSVPLWQRILIGLSIIFGLTGILFYIYAKREVKKMQKHAHS
ncbi:MAG: DUF4198 domain-containing protein [Candidatus Calescibacterium sp.]|nr:DUF4198 domain-containing protein [Candidatus Calescibacterium sp.]MCX7733508.1 DUF4198 domain-containing protein [bacterium]MDW8087221.1 hypothetical protein [Candidatus Calescibacterium sp.]